MKFIVLVMLISICNPVIAGDLPITEKLIQRKGKILQTHIGGQIFKITRESPLPNAFGKADIFGRKVNRGYFELRFLGKTKDGFIKLRIIDVETTSNETTMSRTKINYSTLTGRQTYNPYTHTLNTNANVISIRAPEGKTESLPPNATEFEVDPSEIKEIEFDNVKVVFIESKPTQLKYKLLSN